MNIDEAIRHCEEVAEEKEARAESNLIEIDKIKGILRVYYAEECESCLECARKHRQLAAWLKELKAYKEAEKEIRQIALNANTHDIAMCLDIIDKHQMELGINPQPSVSSEEYCKRCNETQAEGIYDD